MISRTAEQMRGAALLMLNPGCLIDKFLDWLDEWSGALLPARIDELAGNQVRTEALHDRFSA
jgi:hypothetical protein